jgi:hypothetical protein
LCKKVSEATMGGAAELPYASPFAPNSTSRIAAPSTLRLSITFRKSACDRVRDWVGSRGEGTRRERAERVDEVMIKVEAANDGESESIEAEFVHHHWISVLRQRIDVQRKRTSSPSSRFLPTTSITASPAMALMSLTPTFFAKCDALPKSLPSSRVTTMSVRSTVS